MFSLSLLMFLLPSLVICFYKSNDIRPSMNFLSNVRRIRSRKIPNNNELINFRNHQALYVDIFGLGPSEVIIIIGAGLVLYGPDKFKQQLRDSGVKGKIVSAGWRQDRSENIKNMIENAENMRKNRKIKRILDSNSDID